MNNVYLMRLPNGMTLEGFANAELGLKFSFEENSMEAEIDG